MSHPFLSTRRSSGASSDAESSFELDSSFARRARARGADAAPAVGPAAALKARLAGEKIPEAAQAELQGILQHPGDSLIWEEILQFGIRLKDGKHDPAAAAVFSFLQEGSEGVPAEIRSRAQAEWGALAGFGSSGRRWEYLISRFAEQATDAKMIVPMLAGSAVFSLTRTAAMSRLAGMTGRTWFNSGFGARLTAGSLGFALEVPTFSLMSRGLRALNGDPVAWDANSVGKDLLGTTLTLGALKLSGAGGQSLLGSPALRSSRFLSAAVPQSATFFGLMAAHRLEQHFQLRPAADGNTAVTDTLASMVSLGAGSHLGQRLLGPGFAAFQKELEIRNAAQRLRTGNYFPELGAGKANKALAVSGPAGPMSGREPGPLVPPWMAMTAGPPRKLQSQAGKVAETKTSDSSIRLKKSSEPDHLNLLPSLVRDAAHAEGEAWEGYEAALAIIAAKPGHQAARAALLKAFRGHPDAALDALMSYRDLAEIQGAVHARATAKGAHDLAAVDARFLGPAFRLLEAFHRHHALGAKRTGLWPVSQARNVDRVFSGFQTLARMNPEWALAAAENLSAPVLVKPSFLGNPVLRLMETLAKVGKASDAESAYPLVGEFLREYLGEEWRGDKAALQARANQAGKIFRRLEWFSTFPGQAEEVANLLRLMDQDPRVPGYFDEFHKLAILAKLDPAQTFASWNALQLKKNQDRFLVTTEQFYFLGLMAPRDIAAALVTHPDFADDAVSRAIDLDNLLAISYNLPIQAAYYNFVRRRAEYPELGSPHRWLVTFAEIANLEREGVPDGLRPEEIATLPKGTSPEQRTAFLEMFEQVRPKVPSYPPPPDPGSEKEWKRLSFQHPRSAYSDEGDHREPGDHALIMKKYQMFMLYARSLPQDPLTARIAVNLIESLARLGHREITQRPFYRLDLALNLTRVFAPERGVTIDYGRLLARDLVELAGEQGMERGFIMDRWIHRLSREQPAEFVAGIEMILQAAMKPPSRSENNFHASGEHAVLATLDSLLTPNVLATLEAIPLSETTRNLLEKMKGMAERYRNTQADWESRDLTDAVESVFYKEPSLAERFEEETEGMLEAQDFPSLGISPPVAIGAVGAAPAESPEAASQALTRAFSEGGLTRAVLQENPRTGMMEMNLGGGLRVAVWHAASPVRAETSTAIRRDWEELTSGSRSEALREIRELTEEAEGTDADALIPSPRSTALQIASRLETLRKLDSVKLMFQAKFGEEDPEALMVKKIVTAMSIRLGLDLMELKLRQKSGNDALELKNVGQLNRLLPNVTTLELALISLTEKAPKILLEPEGVSMPYRVLLSGIEWANDAYDPDTERQGLYARDPYQYLGVTAVGAGTEYTYFNPWVQRLIKTALKTQLSDRHFFTHFWTHHDESALGGLKLLKEAKGTRVLLNKKVVDADFERELSIADVVRLVGLLEKVPDVLNAPEAARVHFKPFAGGLLFLNAEGRPAEFVPYHPHLQRVGVQEVHYKTEGDMSDRNSMAHQFLGEKLTGELYDGALEQTGGELSALEDRGLEFLSKYRIALPLAARSSMDPRERDMSVFFSARSLKMGMQELNALDRTMALIPPPVLARARDGSPYGGGIRAIRKNHSPSLNFLDWSRQAGTLGFYNSVERTITLEHMQQVPFANLDSVGRQLWEDTLLHEVGEALFDSLSPADKEEVVSLYPWQTRTLGGQADGSRLPGPVVLAMLNDEFELNELVLGFKNAELPLHVLTSYSSANPRDLFCENFQAYLAHGEEFRERAKHSPYLQRYYQWLKDKIFTEDEVSFESIHTPAATFAETEGQIRRWKMEDAKRREDRRIEAAHEKAKSGILASYVESIEGAREAELNADEAADRNAGDRYVDGFFRVARMDETGLALRARLHRRREDAPLRPNWERHVLDGIVHALRYDAFGGNTEIPVRRLSEKIWEAMREGDSERARRLLEKKIDRVLRDYAEIVDMESDVEEIWDLLVETVASRLGEATRTEGRVVETLSHYVLPGFFTVEDLEAIRSILKDKSSRDIQIVRNLYLLVKGKPAWRLTAEQEAALVAEIAEHATYVGRKFSKGVLQRMIAALVAGAEDFYQMAARLKVPAGELDAFAEGFLDPPAYQALLEKSEAGGLELQLRTSLLIHNSLKSQWQQEFGSETVPGELEEGLKKIETALAEVEGRQPDSLARARDILSDTEHSARIDARAREIFHAGINKREKDRNETP